jgi:hypothetical protein
MEFAELIKISRVDGVLVHRPFQPPGQKSLCITGHHLLLSSMTDQVEESMVRAGPNFRKSKLKNIYNVSGLKTYTFLKVDFVTGQD